MNSTTDLLTAIRDAVFQTDHNPDRHIRMSHSMIKRFEACPASYLYHYVIMPRIETRDFTDTANLGSAFHNVAENRFTGDEVEVILDQESDTVINQIQSFEEYVKQQPYFMYDAKTEDALQYYLSDNLSFYGIIDRRCYPDHGEVSQIVVDYKTGQWQNQAKDREQGRGYVFLVHKLENIAPVKIQCIIDYVAIHQQYEYSYTEENLRIFENYLKITGERIRTLEKNFFKSRDMKRIPHARGDCNFCVMKGACIAYMTMINPTPNPGDMRTFSTEELAREFYMFSDMEQIGKERSALIKKTLLERHKKGDRDVARYFSISTGKTEMLYETQSVIPELFDTWIRQTKNAKFADMIDWQKVRHIMLPHILNILPKNLKASALPAEYRKKAEKYKFTSQGNPYLIKKS